MSKEEALELIKKAAETGATELSLYGQDLTKLPSELFQLTKLTELELGLNQLSSLPPQLFQLRNLTKLYLSHNRLSSLPSGILQLTQLKELNLYGNQFSSLPPELFQLTQLTLLGLGGNLLSSLPPKLFRLTNLTSLNLGSLGLTELPLELFQLKKLASLNLYGNKLSSLPPQLFQQTNLTELNLGGLGLTELPPELFQLKKLASLNLYGNQLSSLPPELFQLPNLTSLNLGGLGLAELPPELFQLKKLTKLDLYGNQLSSLPPELFQLIHLTALNLGGLGLAKLPSELFQLTNLQKLYLVDNRLSSLPPELGLLTKLTLLHLGSNQLSSLPPELFQLTNLTELVLFNNQLSCIPSELILLTNLKGLILDGNLLSSLPPELVQLPRLSRFKVYRNPLVNPPVELAEQGIEAVREYFSSIKEGSQELAEVKIILIGEGASGKTSLTRLLCEDHFNPQEPMTHGIRINEWTAANRSRKIRCNIWDFGGQEIMQATHQFFLSRRSLYILVLDGRKDEKPEHWLRYIETFGGGSPVFVVLNRYDVHPGFDVDRIALQRKFPFIKGFYQTSCYTGYGIEDFTHALREALDNVPMTKNQWPLSWFRAKALLEQGNEPRILCKQFEDICLKAGVRGETSRNVLLDFLHDLGKVIHFKGFELDENHVLTPKWVTGAVYKIINAEPITASKGLLKLDDLKEIMRWKEGEEFKYWPADYVFIISLMKKFELCYELNEKEVLIPQLLGVSEPSFKFDYSNALRFELRYEDFFPPSIMPRFIVKRHQEINDGLRWRTGVVLANPMLDATAVVRADNEAKRIQIMVTGKDSKLFLALICLTFRELHAGIEGLKVSERIPLPDQPALSVAYKTLLNYAEKKLETIIPEGTEKAYSVQELLNGVRIESAGDREKVLAMVKADSKEGGLRWLIKKTNRYVEGNIELFGLKINYPNITEDLLEWLRK